MNISKSLTVTIAAAALGSGVAVAQDDSDVTITLLPQDAELPDAVTALIELPKDADGNYIPSEEGVTHSADGLATANDARENGREFGQETAEQAQQNREDFVHGTPDLSELLPDQVPDDVPVPDLPDVPQPPVPPGRP
jgi:hypothetical protein